MANMQISRIVLATSLATLVAVIAGCGGASSSNPGSASVTRPAAGTQIADAAQSSSAPARGPSARAQYAGFARAVNLQPGDVPEFVAEASKPRHVKPHNKAFEDESQYGRCLRVRKEEAPLLKAHSDKFKAGAGLHLEEVSSDVEVAPTIATAQRELAEARKALQSAASRRCFARVFDSLGAQSQPYRVGKGSVRIAVGNLHLAPLQLDSATSSTDGSFGFSMSITVTYTVSARGRTLTIPTSLQLDQLGFLVGRAGIKLNVLTFGAVAFPPELEATLFSRLISRALTASHTYPSIKK